MAGFGINKKLSRKTMGGSWEAACGRTKLEHGRSTWLKARCCEGDAQPAHAELPCAELIAGQEPQIGLTACPSNRNVQLPKGSERQQGNVSKYMKRGRLDLPVGRFFVLWTLLALVFWWWLGQERTGLRQLQQTGVIRIGYAVEAPYAFLSPQGRVTGESPEIARVIVERLKIRRIHWRATEFTNLIEELRGGQFDVIAAGLFITPERQELVQFSRPTFRAAPALLVPRSAHLTHFPLTRQEFPRPIAVLSGSAEEDRWLSAGNSAQDLLITPDAHAASVSLQRGRARSVALSAPSLGWMNLGHPDWVVVQDQRAKADLGGFAFRLEDRKLALAWNEELKLFLGSPQHLALVKTFGFEKMDLP